MIALPLAVALIAKVPNPNQCFPLPYSAISLDISSSAPYNFSAKADGSYINIFLNGTVMQTGIIRGSMVDSVDGACLVDATAVIPGTPNVTLALRSYRNEAFKSWDICYDIGTPAVMPKSCVGAFLWAAYKDNDWGPAPGVCALDHGGHPATKATGCQCLDPKGSGIALPCVRAASGECRIAGHDDWGGCEAECCM